MRAIVDPFARRRDPFPGGDRRRMADDGDQVPMSARLRSQNAKAVLERERVSAVICSSDDCGYIVTERRQTNGGWPSANIGKSS